MDTLRRPMAVELASSSQLLRCARAAARRRALALASERLSADIERLLPSLNLDVAFVSRVDLLSAAIETSCPDRRGKHPS